MTLLPLKAGPLSMAFDDGTAFLRYVRWGDQEVIRAVFAAIRDHNWDTIPYELHDLRIEADDHAFCVTFRAECQHESIGFYWDGQIVGQGDGSVEYRFHGRAMSAFLKNRIGLCVLHPIRECAGAECVVEHIDASITTSAFPQWISPYQPFKNMRSISHSLGTGARVKVTMSGDTFEMEDQRNWSDASFKTYSPPLELPFPVRVESESIIEQSVAIELLGTVAPRDPAPQPSTLVEIDWGRPLKRPLIGFLLTDPASHRVPAAVERLRQLSPDHLRVDIKLREGDWRSHLRAAQGLCRSVGAALEIALFAEVLAGQAWEQFQEAIRDSDIRVARCLLFHPAQKTTPAALTASAAGGPFGLDRTIPLVVGTDAYFAEFNRGAVHPAASQLVCFSINPQVHAFDNLSLRETLEALPAMVDSAHHLSGARIVISPVSLRPRFNPNAISQALSRDEELRQAIDPRQSTGFAAAWTVGVLASLATNTHVQSLTIYEASGPRGVQGEKGEAYPMTAVFECLLDCSQIFRARVSRSLDVQALGFQRADGVRGILLANMSDAREVVDVSERSTARQQVAIEPESVYILSTQAGLS